jgi:hypothetical protein
MRRASATALIVSMCCATSWALEIPLTIEEPVGVARQGAPISSGVCLPRGQFPATQRFALFDGETAIPLQTTPLVVERDGTLRWVLLDFQTNVGPREVKKLTLRTEDKNIAPKVVLQITEDNDAISINTGPLRFAVSKTKPFKLCEGVSIDGKPVAEGDAVDYVEAKTGTRYVAGRPQTVAFEYRGPLRATLRVSGEYEPESSSGPLLGAQCRLKYITRLTAWAGRTDIHIQHILANSNSEQVFHANLKNARLSLRHGQGGTGILPAKNYGQDAHATSGGLSAKLDDAGSVWLHQGKENRYYSSPIADAGKAGIGDQVKWTGADSGGWIAVRGGETALLVCDRDFLGDPPRKLVADKDRLTVEFISEKFNAGRGVPFASDYLWLYDLSHKTADVWVDFAVSGDLDASAQASRERLLAFAPGEWYSQCDALGVGPFGTLEDEKKVYQQWGWKFDEKKLPKSAPAPHAFVRWEDNHYESEADSAEALLLMAIRTGQRGFFDQGEAWARYHANLHAWRTDGWVYDDGAIWFPQGGPLGTMPVRKPTNMKYEHWGKGSGDDRELWHLVQAKACYCHFYGAGLVDYFLLTGERDALEAALDLAEQKNSEFRKHRKFAPGKTTISDTRGFGRGFYVITHLLEAAPDNKFVADLAQLCRDVLWQCPDVDERGFAPCHIGTGFGGFDPKKDLSPNMKRFMDQEGIVMDEKGWLTDKKGNRWPVVCLGGTWQHGYVDAAAERYARLFGDENMADFAIAFGKFAAKFMLSEKCKQTHYYAYMDVPLKGQAWDPWKFEPPHTETKDGEGCIHSGWYTRFFPDAMARAYSLGGDPALLNRAREFWHYGSKRGYQTKTSSAGWDAVGAFAAHVPPKDDSVLSTSRMFYEWSHPRRDSAAPRPIQDLTVVNVGGEKAVVSFTAPADVGGGKVVRYQVKCAGLPIVAYDEYDFARDDGVKRNFWRAINLRGEPRPSAPGTKEQFAVEGVPDTAPLYFVVASFDDSNNCSTLSNLVRLEGATAPKKPSSRND